MSLFTKNAPPISVKDFYAQHKDEILKLVPDVSVKEFYSKHKDDLLKLVGSEHFESPKLSGLKYEITSRSGKRYYSFPEKFALPFLRMAKSIELMNWLYNGLLASHFDDIRESMIVNNANIIANIKTPDVVKKNALDNGLLLSELERRRINGAPYYVFVNLYANWLIREDEDPYLPISAPINHQKCDEIEEMIADGNHGFFLTIPQLKILSELTGSSLEGLTKFLKDSQIEAEKENQWIKAYLSWKEGMPKKTTS